MLKGKCLYYFKRLRADTAKNKNIFGLAQCNSVNSAVLCDIRRFDYETVAANGV